MKNAGNFIIVFCIAAIITLAVLASLLAPPPGPHLPPAGTSAP